MVKTWHYSFKEAKTFVKDVSISPGARSQRSEEITPAPEMQAGRHFWLKWEDGNVTLAVGDENKYDPEEVQVVELWQGIDYPTNGSAGFLTFIKFVVKRMLKWLMKISLYQNFEVIIHFIHRNEPKHKETYEDERKGEKNPSRK